MAKRTIQELAAFINNKYFTSYDVYKELDGFGSDQKAGILAILDPSVLHVTKESLRGLIISHGRDNDAGQEVRYRYSDCKVGVVFQGSLRDKRYLAVEFAGPTGYIDFVHWTSLYFV